MSSERHLSEPLQQHAVTQLLRHLDREEAFLRELQQFAGRLRCAPLDDAEQAAWIAGLQRLQDEAVAIRGDRDQLPVQGRLSQAPLPPRDRPLLNRRRQELLRQAGQTAGALRGMMTSLSAWNGLMQSALDALLGVSPLEGTYSSSGGRASPHRRVILDVRS